MCPVKAPTNTSRIRFPSSIDDLSVTVEDVPLTERDSDWFFRTAFPHVKDLRIRLEIGENADKAEDVRPALEWCLRNAARLVRLNLLKISVVWKSNEMMTGLENCVEAVRQLEARQVKWYLETAQSAFELLDVDAYRYTTLQDAIKQHLKCL